jgi:hypothetical protein
LAVDVAEKRTLRRSAPEFQAKPHPEKTKGQMSFDL